MLLGVTVRRNVVTKLQRYVASSHRYLSTTTRKDEDVKGKYDVIIAGGGMVGCTLACAMGKDPILSQLNVLLLEGSPETNFVLKPEYSNRVVALNQNTKSLMSSLDVWRHVEDMRLQPVRHMQVWDASSDAMISFSSDDIEGDDLAYIVENDVLLHAINTELKSPDVQNVEILYGSKIAQVELKNETNSSQDHIVRLANGDAYSCQLLVGADGARSAVRAALRAPYLAGDYGQTGVVATLQLAEEGENVTAWQQFGGGGGGVLALLPLGPARASLVWSLDAARAASLMALSHEQFVDAINDALWKPAGGGGAQWSAWLDGALRSAGLAGGGERLLPPSVAGAGPRAAFPLAHAHAARHVGPGAALVGDAARRVHPLAGQGLNLGLGDVRELARRLAAGLYAGQPLGGAAALREYEAARARHAVPTQLAVHALQRLYARAAGPPGPPAPARPPWPLLRALPLQLAHALPPLKKMLMSHAAS